MAAVKSKSADEEPPVQAASIDSPKKLYSDSCREWVDSGAPCKKPNSKLMSSLSDQRGAFDITIMDLSDNYVGSRGILPVLKIVQQCRKLEKFIVANNYLSNESMVEIGRAVASHPSIHHIDVSGNPISWAGGTALLELLTKNPRLRTLEFKNTNLPDEVVRALNKRLQYNQKWVRPEKPATISDRLRAVKTAFQEICLKEKTKDKVRRKHILTGFRTNLKLLGGAREGGDDPVFDFDFGQQLQARCQPDSEGYLSWEAFLVGSMCPDVRVCHSDIKRLRDSFEHWDKNKNGVIEPGELKDMMAHINGRQPTNEEVMDRMFQFGGEGSRSITWDMFVIMLYEWLQGAPSAGGFSRRPSTVMMVPSKTPRKL